MSHQHGSWCGVDAVWPRPCRAAWSIGPSRRRLRGVNGPCSFRVDALLRARSLLSVARTIPGPDHLGLLCRWLATPLRLSPPTRSSARHCRLGCAPGSDCPPLDSNLVFSRLHRDSKQIAARLRSQTSDELHGAPRLTCLAFSAPFLWGPWVRFDLSPLTLLPPLAPPLLIF